MDLALPDWLTNEFLTQCLQCTQQDIVVTNHVVSPVVAPGNNYCSIIVRVNVEYKSNTDDSEIHSISLILKSELTEGSVKEILDNNPSLDLQQSEYDFYYKFLPKAEKLTDIGFAPKFYFPPRGRVTVLEDLKEKGFVMADRTKQLDFDHCRLYMEAAASMHAASFAVHKEDPKLIESMGVEKMFSNEAPGHEVFRSMIKGGMEVFARTTEKVERFKKYADVIRKVTPFLWESLLEIHKPSESINSINQGDPWTTNMMFKYDEKGNVSEVKMIDFQCLRYGSPFNDVVFFIWMSANNYVKSHKLDELYQIYLQTFNSELKHIRCAERLTFEHMNECVKKLSPLTIFLVATMLPLLIHRDPLDFGKFLPRDREKSEEIVLNHYMHYYNEKYCKEHVPLSLEQLEKAGVFQDLKSLIK